MKIIDYFSESELNEVYEEFINTDENSLLCSIIRAYELNSLKINDFSLNVISAIIKDFVNGNTEGFDLYTSLLYRKFRKLSRWKKEGDRPWKTYNFLENNFLIAKSDIFVTRYFTDRGDGFLYSPSVMAERFCLNNKIVDDNGIFAMAFPENPNDIHGEIFTWTLLWRDDLIRFKCKIPQGAKYTIDDRGHYISNKLEIIKSLNTNYNFNNQQKV